MDLVGIIYLILGFALVGFLVFLIVTYIPMPDIFKTVIMVAVAILCILYLLGLVSGSAALPRFGPRVSLDNSRR